MRGRRCRDGGLAYVAAVLLLLASLPESQCRPQLLEAGGRSSSSNDSDVVLVFCQWSKCGSDWSTCYCCLSTEPRACYDTRDECRANCVVCNPRCPSAAVAPTGGGRPAVTRKQQLYLAPQQRASVISNIIGLDPK